MKKDICILLAAALGLCLICGCEAAGAAGTSSDGRGAPAYAAAGSREPGKAQESAGRADAGRFTDNGDQTVTDAETGLIWQKGEIFDISADRIKTAAAELDAGGLRGWRAPSMLELLSVVDVRLNRPPFSEALGRSESEYYWSCESTPGMEDRVWVLNAGGGTGNKAVSESRAAGGEKIYSLKCVRGEWMCAAPRYTDNGDGTVSDALLKLIWRQDAAHDLSLAEAYSYIDDLNAESPCAWRLPTMPELAMLCDRSLSAPAVEKRYFPGLSPDKYWTSSPLTSRDRQWYADLTTGMTTYDPPESRHSVVAVREMTRA